MLKALGIDTTAVRRWELVADIGGPVTITVTSYVEKERLAEATHMLSTSRTWAKAVRTIEREVTYELELAEDGSYQPIEPA